LKFKCPFLALAKVHAKPFLPIFLTILFIKTEFYLGQIPLCWPAILDHLFLFYAPLSTNYNKKLTALKKSLSRRYRKLNYKKLKKLPLMKSPLEKAINI